MNLQPQPIDSPEINLTPLIDVVFLMLVFFFLSTTFIRQSTLEVNLPAADSGSSATTSDIEIHISATGVMQINHHPLASSTSDAIASGLTQALDAQSTREVRLIIKAHGAAPHRLIARVLDQAAQLGLTNVAIAVKESP
jgi:biopolymer transport protein ExbD